MDEQNLQLIIIKYKGNGKPLVRYEIENDDEHLTQEEMLAQNGFYIIEPEIG